jgi:hypothetical protein
MYLDIFCNELHDDLTDRLQTDVCTQPSGHKLLQPYPNTQNHVAFTDPSTVASQIYVSTSNAASRLLSS